MTAKIITFQNREPISPFSAIYKYSILEYDIDPNYMKFLEEYILSVEQEIIKTIPSSATGYTGLGPDSLTSRFQSINFFKCHEFSSLKEQIKNLSLIFLDSIGHKNFNENIYGHCWANVMRTGEQIAKHQHSDGDLSFLSGNIVVKHNGSHTYYCDIYDNDNKYISENSVGKMTLFPSWLKHGSSKVEDGVRITIAFDLMNQKLYDIYPNKTYQLEHWVQI